MARPVMKYNPAFLSPAELIDQFVVRHGDLDTVLQTVRENTTNANQHVLVIGPRGSGKTMLVRRVAAEIERDPELREHWYPLIVSEESYEVTTPGEFWLEAAFHLGQQTKDPRWQAKYEEYGSQWQNEDAMREQALAQLMAFADEQGKRLLVIVENLNGLLGDQLSDDDAWKLRHTLQNEPRVMLLATATSRFEEIDNANKAMYELFRVHHLRPLETDECRAVWQSLTGQLLEGDQVRPIQILTGGNLRLLTILSAFGAGLSFRQLMGDLVGLVDDHTGYFKSHLDALPPIERKVYLALAELWDPSTAREVAAAARLDVNRTSSLLRRLVDRGAVATLDDPKRTKWYQLAERMYNIYYLFRRRGSPAERVRAVVRFMVSFYAPDELLTAARRIADEVCGLDPTERQDHYQVCYDLVNQSSVDSLRNQLIEVARDRFAGLDDVPGMLAKMIGVPKLSREHAAIVEEAAARGGELARAMEKAKSLLEESNFPEAEHAVRGALEIDPQYARGWAFLGRLLCDRLSRFDEAEQAYRKAVEINPQYAGVWARLGLLLHVKLSRFDEAEQAYREAIEIDPQNAWANYALLDLLLAQPERRAEAIQFAETVVARSPGNPQLLNFFAWKFSAKGELALMERALSWAGEAVDLAPDNGRYRHTLASIQCALGNLQDALQSAEKYLADEKAVRDTLEHATNLMVELAARGEGRKALQILLDSPSREQLEPLVAGIRIFLGEDVTIAAEIKEIGLDVARWIQQRRDALQAASA